MAPDEREFFILTGAGRSEVFRTDDGAVTVMIDGGQVSDLEGNLSLPFTQRAVLYPGMFAFLTVDIQPKSDAPEKPSIYHPLKKNFVKGSIIEMKSLPNAAIGSVDFGDVVAVNTGYEQNGFYSRGLYVAPTVPDFASFQKRLKVLRRWSSWDPSAGYEVASARLVKSLYDRIGGLDASLSAVGGKIDSSAATAGKLAVPRLFWGREFDGTKDVSGGLDQASYVNLGQAAEGTEPKLGVGKSGEKLTLGGPKGVAIKTNPGAGNYVSIEAAGDAPAAGKLKIGGALLSYDPATRSLQLSGDASGNVNFYATGGISAYGATADSGLEYFSVKKAISVGGTRLSAEGSESVVATSTNFSMKASFGGPAEFSGEAQFSAEPKMTAGLSVRQTLTADNLVVGGGDTISNVHIVNTTMYATVGGKTYHWSVYTE